jgi:hypothetical protein
VALILLAADLTLPATGGHADDDRLLVVAFRNGGGDAPGS